MGIQTSRWDAVEHLDSKEAILAYLEAVFKDGDPALIAVALNDIARATGIIGEPSPTDRTDVTAVLRTLEARGWR